MRILRDNPFHPAPDAPLYQQLYGYLRAAILAGQLKGGSKLPSTRALATELGAFLQVAVGTRLGKEETCNRIDSPLKAVLLMYHRLGDNLFIDS